MYRLFNEHMFQFSEIFCLGVEFLCCIGLFLFFFRFLVFFCLFYSHLSGGEVVSIFVCFVFYFIKFYWHIVDLQCYILVADVQLSKSYI